MSFQELPTRQQVLHLLKINGRMTVKQLSEALGITPMGVRQHLDGLSKEQLITFEWLREGRGRPSQVFSLTPKGDELFPRAYGQLALSLLSEMRDVAGDETINQLFARRAEKMRARYQERLSGLEVEGRVAELARLRAAEGYLAKYTKVDDDTYWLVEHNCPVCLVSAEYPESCEHEHALFASLLGDDVTVTREDHIAAGDRQCRYVIRRSKPRDSAPCRCP